MRLIVRVMAGTILGAAFAIIGNGLYGLFYALIVGLNKYRHAGVLIEETLWGLRWGLLAGVILALPGALIGAIVAFLHFLWIRSTDRRALVIIYSLLGVIVLVFGSLSYYQNRQNEAAIEARYLRFCPAVYNHWYKEAYTYMTPEYRRTHTLNEFVLDEELKSGLYNDIDLWGCSLDPKYSIDVSGNQAIVWPGHNAFMEWYGGPSYELERIDGEWYFTGESEWYVD
jgi:4-amino-4-deoxy-L-arabinose transferase-like glycosyltransferase